MQLASLVISVNILKDAEVPNYCLFDRFVPLNLKLLQAHGACI